MAVTANRDRQATKITSVHGSHLRVGEVVGNLEHLDRGHDVEVHDGLGKARDVPQLCNPQHSGPKDSEKLQEDRPPAQAEMLDTVMLHTNI